MSIHLNSDEVLLFKTSQTGLFSGLLE
jgi:hypothetical protein